MNVGTLTAFFKLDTEGFYSSLNNVENQIKLSAKTVREAASSISKSTSKAFTLVSNSSGRVAGDIKKSSTSVSRDIGIMSSSFSNLIPKIAKTTAAVGSLIVVSSGIKRFAERAAELESMSRTLGFISGNAQQASESLNFLRKNSERLGTSIETSVKSFVSMTAAAKGTALEGEGVRQLYLAISEAAAAMGLSTERTKLAFLAVQQMMSKGKVSSEELSQQLGEHLPGALQIMSRSLGVTTAELLNMAKEGALVSEKVLPLFARQIRVEMQPAIADIGDSTAATIGRMKNSWFELQKSITESQILSVVTTIMDGVTAAIKTATSAVEAMKKAWDSLANFISSKEIKTSGLMAVLEQTDKKYAKHLDNLRAGTTKASEEIQDTTFRIQSLAEAQQIGSMAMSEYTSQLGFMTGSLYEASSFAKNLATELKFVDFESQLKDVPPFIEEMSIAFRFGERALHGFTEAIHTIIVDGTLDFKEFSKKIIADMTDIALEILVVIPLLNALRDALSGVSSGYSSMSKGFLSGGHGGKLSSGLFEGLASGSRSASEFSSSLLPSRDSNSQRSNSSSLGDTQNGNTINIAISALDSKSLVDLMKSNPQAITAPISEALSVGDKGLIQSIRGAL